MEERARNAEHCSADERVPSPPDAEILSASLVVGSCLGIANFIEPIDSGTVNLVIRIIYHGPKNVVMLGDVVDRFEKPVNAGLFSGSSSLIA